MQSINSFKRLVNSHSVSDSVKCWMRREAFLIEQKWLFLGSGCTQYKQQYLNLQSSIFGPVCGKRLFFFSKDREDFGASDPSTVSTVTTSNSETAVNYKTMMSKQNPEKQKIKAKIANDAVRMLRFEHTKGVQWTLKATANEASRGQNEYRGPGPLL